MTASDVLSILRFALALVIAGVATLVFYPGAPALIFFAFLLGAATDIVGAVLARGRETLPGRVLDSIADKALVYGVLIPIALRGFPPVAVLLPLAARDVIAVALQIAAVRQGFLLPAGTLGRLKTATLYSACALLLTLAWLQSGSSPVFVDPGDLGTILPFLLVSQLAIVIGTVLSYISLFRYIATFRSPKAP